MAAIVLVALAGASIAAWRACDCLGTNRGFPHSSERVLVDFVAAPEPSVDAYERLVGYFVDGFLTYRTPDGAHARYPGWPMGQGTPEDRHEDLLEGFTRVAPLLASWLHGGRAPEMRTPSGRSVDVAALLREGIIKGTDSRSNAYWGAIGNRDSRIVEAHDVALSLWLAREWTWDRMSHDEQRRVAQWLRGVNGREVADNNWHLFITVVNLVLQDLGVTSDRLEAIRHYQRFKSFYLGNGWFRDGPNGEVDYYNAWGMHYSLFWISRIDPKFDAGFLRDSLADFVASFKYFFGPYGIPIMGRSICYRMAAPAPLVMAHIAGITSLSAGEARRALDLTWRHFVQAGAVENGAVTQGYCAADPRWLDGYSGPASCLWSLRSLVAALYIPRDSLFWRSKGEALPVERGDFDVELRAMGRRIVGTVSSGDVRIESRNAGGVPVPPRIQEYTLFRRITDVMLCRSRRPSNSTAKYELPVYSAREPFCGCAMDPLR